MHLTLMRMHNRYVFAKILLAVRTVNLETIGLARRELDSKCKMPYYFVILYHDL